MAEHSTPSTIHAAVDVVLLELDRAEAAHNLRTATVRHLRSVMQLAAANAFAAQIEKIKSDSLLMHLTQGVPDTVLLGILEAAATEGRRLLTLLDAEPPAPSGGA